MPYKDPSKKREHNIKYIEDLKQHVYDSITLGIIIVRCTWNAWCNRIKRCATQKKHPYSKDFTNDIIFKMMLQGCFYCGDIAMTIDRIDSKLDHTPDNCVGCCIGCNKSKGAADPDTFIRKAYYRARGEYYDDDTDIWFEHKNKPAMSGYKRKGVPFELTKDEWDKLVVGECAYCHRSPTTWFGVDQIVPSKGYVDGNVATSCYDCNLDKLEDDVKTMRARNERIVQRMDAGELIIGDHEKVILHKGKQSSSMTVCANGKVYESQSAASKALEKGEKYVGNCIYDKRHPDDIFEVSKEFYEEYKNSDVHITKNMFVAFNRLVL